MSEAPSPSLQRVPCPACGGAGGGPFGPAGSAWDDEEYACPTCEGLGVVLVSADGLGGRPGIVKAVTPSSVDEKRVDEKRKATG
jgi:hypothetical protein